MRSGLCRGQLQDQRAGDRRARQGRQGRSLRATFFPSTELQDNAHGEAAEGRKSRRKRKGKKKGKRSAAAKLRRDVGSAKTIARPPADREADLDRAPKRQPRYPGSGTPRRQGRDRHRRRQRHRPRGVRAVRARGRRRRHRLSREPGRCRRDRRDRRSRGTPRDRASRPTSERRRRAKRSLRR